ncbi:MAG: bifunctional alpha,alpha-trehalose-phosphate synthase (UDP-forming)/trehalose-phosphatase [Actinobacteria bacterium]|nr:bifunctional alpha,alpha-trehalose-phosphate synthase (UDP-forming)/trehalose-phosphatase [Actinomycetota bacterium]
MPDLHEFVVVANRLPVDRREEPDGSTSWRPSPGGLVAALEPVMKARDGAWVGWTGSPDDILEPFDADGMHLVPVPLSAEEVELYYEGMSNATLWPLYHDVIVAPAFHRTWWDSYVAVNRRFAQAVLPQAAEGATVWVQDYQLQLVPKMLRETRPDLRIGFFDHIPFPPYEIFAQLPWRRQVLEGLLGADLLGFQRPADANNLLRAARRLGMTTRGDAVLVDGRRARRGARLEAARPVVCKPFPISVDSTALEELARRPEVLERAKEIRAELGEPDTLVLGVDRLDYTKGIQHRLQAFGELLEDERLTVPGAVLVQVATPSRERVDEYQRIREDVEATVGRINGKHGQIGHPAVHYLHQTVDRAELAALYLAADVMLVTPLRDGMNLVAKEYVASRWDDAGTLVLSEFAGAANELTSAFVVNPHDIDGLKDAVMSAVRCPPAEARKRMRAMRRTVLRDDVAHWARTFLESLHDVRARQEAMTPPPDAADLDAALETLAQRPELLVALDFDGVLAPIVRDPDAARPLPAAAQALHDLAALPGVHLALVSGRTLDDLRRLADPPPSAALVGSHGAQVADEHGADVGAATTLDDATRDLLARASAALHAISARYPGTFVEDKPAGTVFHTRQIERREDAEAAAREAAAGPGAWSGVRTTLGKEVVDLSVVDVDKGVALGRLRVALGLRPGHGGVLYVGDDVTDEHAFAVLDDAAGDVTVKVGEGVTGARHRVADPERVADLLGRLLELVGKDRGTSAAR